MNTGKPCDLSGIRVWRGYCSETLFHQRDTFHSQLKRIFIPQTAQQMMPLGLQAYFPAIVPKNNIVKELLIPDEIALVLYSSNKVYHEATKNSVAGRAYGLLHSTVFNFNNASPIPTSQSQSPLPWQLNWEWNQAYALLTNAIDWHQGQTTTLLAQPAEYTTPTDFYQIISELIKQWISEDKGHIDGAIICATPYYLLYWEHSQTPTPISDHKNDQHSFIPRLRKELETPHICQSAKVIHIPPAFTLSDDGVECEAGELLSVRRAEPAD